jgi:hypothetical protein
MNKKTIIKNEKENNFSFRAQEPIREKRRRKFSGYATHGKLRSRYNRSDFVIPLLPAAPDRRNSPSIKPKASLSASLTYQDRGTICPPAEDHQYHYHYHQSQLDPSLCKRENAVEEVTKDCRGGVQGCWYVELLPPICHLSQ